jgi:hypothetical protein
MNPRPLGGRISRCTNPPETGEEADGRIVKSNITGRGLHRPEGRCHEKSMEPPAQRLRSLAKRNRCFPPASGDNTDGAAPTHIAKNAANCAAALARCDVAFLCSGNNSAPVCENSGATRKSGSYPKP